MSLVPTDVLIRGPQASAPQAPAGPRADAERLKALAAQFEAILVSQMLRQMRDSMFDDGEGASTGPLADSLFNELSLAISRAGGIGLTEALASPLERQVGEGVAGWSPSTVAASSGEAASAVPAAMTAVLPAPEPLSSALLAGRVSSAYGWRRDPFTDELKFHRGVDLALPAGHAVAAPMAGRVAFAGETPGHGLNVVLDHGGQVQTRYSHLSRLDVQAGDEVTEGQPLGEVGATGRATGPHLHFEVSDGGRSVNPAAILASLAASRPQ